MASTSIRLLFMVALLARQSTQERQEKFIQELPSYNPHHPHPHLPLHPALPQPLSNLDPSSQYPHDPYNPSYPQDPYNPSYPQISPYPSYPQVSPYPAYLQFSPYPIYPRNSAYSLNSTDASFPTHSPNGTNQSNSSYVSYPLFPLRPPPYPQEMPTYPHEQPYPSNTQNQSYPSYPQDSFYPSYPQDPSYPSYPQNPSYPNYPQNPYPNYPQNPYPNYPQNPYPNYPQNPYPSYPSYPYPQNPYPSYPQLPSYPPYPSYPFPSVPSLPTLPQATTSQPCRVGGMVGTCVGWGMCGAMGGSTVGMCGATDECCHVSSSCGTLSSHVHSYFRNPSHPLPDTLPRTCPYTVIVPPGVCGLRLVFEQFELSGSVGSCTHDALTVFGTGASSIFLCGNLTAFQTSFPVEAGQKVDLVMTLQAAKPYNFSIQVSQLYCHEIQHFTSPPNTGTRNINNPHYNPATTEAPTTDDPTTDDPSTEDPTTDDPSTEDPTTSMIPEEEDDDDSSDENTGRNENVGQNEGSDDVTFDGFWRLRRPNRARPDLEWWVRQQEEDEEDEDATFRIVDGEHARLNEFPWQVALLAGSVHLCGGSLVAEDLVLTAAHCVLNGVFSSAGLSRLRVVLGDHDLNTTKETHHITRNVSGVSFHVNYDPKELKNDVALVFLDSPVPVSDTVAPIALSQETDPDYYAGSQATHAGWGRHDTKSSKSSQTLRSYTAAVVGLDQCVAAWANNGTGQTPDHTNACLDVTWGNPCHGDSGGPLVVCEGEECTLVGVLSYGSDSCRDEGYPEVFARVPAYLAWLDLSLTTTG